MSCPECNSEDIKLVRGSPTNPKALYICKKCGRTFYGHEVGLAKKLGE